MKKIIWILYALIFGSKLGHTQQSLNYEQALDIALRNNLTVQKSRQNEKWKQALIGTYKEIPKTSLNTEYGQVNSALFDAKLGISQTLFLPQVHKAKKLVLQNDVKRALLETKLSEYTTAQVLKVLCNEYDYLHQKRLHLQAIEAVYKDYFKRLEVQISKGLVGEVERMKNTLLVDQLQLSKVENEQETELCVSRFRIVLNTDQKYFPTANDTWKQTYNGQHLHEHSSVQLYRQAESELESLRIYEKSKLLPEVNLAFTNNSFRGVGPDNISYSAINRFSSILLGVNIPVFKKAEKAKIESFALEAKLNQQATDLQLQELKNREILLMKEYLNTDLLLRSISETQVPKAKELEKTMAKLVDKGEISLKDYFEAQVNSLQLVSTQLDLINKCNEIVCDLNFLTIK